MFLWHITDKKYLIYSKIVTFLFIHLVKTSALTNILSDKYSNGFVNNMCHVQFCNVNITRFSIETKLYSHKTDSHQQGSPQSYKLQSQLSLQYSPFLQQMVGDYHILFV